MAITEKYVTADGTEAWATNDITHPSSLTEAFSSAAAGDRVNIKAGTYTRTANDNPAVYGSAASPIIWRGYNSTIGDLDSQGHNADGTLNTTNFPIIAYNNNYRLSAQLVTYSIWQNIKFTGSVNNALIYSNNTSTVFFRIYCDNANTGASTSAIMNACVIDCDALLSGGSGGHTAISCASGIVAYCRVMQSQAAGINITGNGSAVIGCTIDDVAGDGIAFTSTTTTHIPPVCIGNTIYSCGGAAIAMPNAANVRILVAINNIFAEAASYNIESAYAGTGNISLINIFNRSISPTSGDTNGFADWVSALAIGNVTGGAVATEFTDAAAGDFRLKAGAGAKGVGIWSPLDMGAIQRTYDLPAVGNVTEDDTVEDATGTYHEATEAEVQSGVQFGADSTEFTGEYAGGSSKIIYKFPNIIGI